MYINIHTHYTLKSTNTLLVFNLNKRLDFVNENFSAGIHPWYIKNENEKDFEVLKSLLKNKYCLALGECGLDKVIEIDFDLQKDIFLKQLELNKEFQKPIILHCVKAYQETLEIIENYNYCFVFHGFNKGKELAHQMQGKAHYLSFGKAILKNEKNQEALRTCNLNQVFFETDNDDINIETIYQKAAEILNLPLETLQTIILNNYKTVFDGNTKMA